MRINKHLFTVLLFLLFAMQAMAQQFSYVYIQGDKQIPFYVKLDNEMMPRYGKNYCIISQLAPGPLTIEILFQQNAFPSQKFTINVPQDGYRGFLLLKRSNAFSLYDIQQQFYLRAGNKIEEDHMPDATASSSYIVTKSNTEPVKHNTPVRRNQPRVNNNQSNSGPQFIENIELNSKHSVQQQTNTANDVYNDNIASGTVTNSDCPQAISNDAFEAIYNRASDKPEDARLRYLLTRLDQCYTTNQVRLLAKTLTNDPERYTFLKRVYPRVTNQAAFPSLESLLSTEEWKGFFKLIVP